MKCLCQRNGLSPIACFPNYPDFSYAFEPGMQPLSNQGFILNQEQRNDGLLIFVIQLRCPLWRCCATLWYTGSEYTARYRSYSYSVLYVCSAETSIRRSVS